MRPVTGQLNSASTPVRTPV